MDWMLKTAAYLSKSPAYALFPDEDRELTHNLVQAACGFDFPEEKIKEAWKIQQIAAGMDIPPFLEKLDGSCFLRNPVLTHALSGQQYKLDLPADLLPQKVANHIKETLGKIVRDSDAREEKENEKEKKLFFALWRNFPEKLTANDPNGLGKLWKILPADPRIPSHTIWEHAAVSSAVAGAWPEPALLIFTLASVQEMVTTARRTQDAWMGSFLWSYLSWRAMEVVVNACGPDAIISPSLLGQPIVDWWLSGKWKSLVKTPPPQFLEIANIPNMFTAIVPAGQAEELAEKCKEAVQKGWGEISAAVKKSVKTTYEEKYKGEATAFEWDETWKRQGDAFIQNQGVFWVVCPWGNNFQDVWNALEKQDENFCSMLLNMEKKGCSEPHIGMATHFLSSFAGMELTARKNLRDFKQTEEPGFKCSLCGKWTALHPGASLEVPNYSALKEFWQNLSVIDREKSGRMKLVGRIRRGDMLCSICLTRRLALESFFEDEMGLDHHMFPSTSGVATAAYRGTLLKVCAKSAVLSAAVKEYVNCLKPFIMSNFAYPAAANAYLINCGRKSGMEECAWKDFLNIDGDWLLPTAFEKNDRKAASDISFDESKRQERKGKSEEPEKPAKSLEAEAQDHLINTVKKIAIDGDMPLGDPPGYYAILALDGDNMGDWVTGAKKCAPRLQWLIHPDCRQEKSVTDILSSEFIRPVGPSMQLALSDSLKNFSLKFARDIVESQHAGKLVYAGGDDLLAFLPLEHLLPVMKSLYCHFRGRKDGFDEKDSDLLRLAGGIHPRGGGFHHEGMTVSMGVIIVHHSYPLYHAMSEAQNVLKELAKKQLGRNAFAFRVLRRSGEPTEGGFKFNTEKSKCVGDVILLLEQTMDFIKKGSISGRLPYSLGMHRWAGTNRYDDEMDEARRSELARITARHIAGGLSAAEKSEVKKTILNLFDAIRNKNTEREGGMTQVNPWDMTARLLLILRFMAGKER